MVLASVIENQLLVNSHGNRMNDTHYNRMYKIILIAWIAIEQIVARKKNEPYIQKITIIDKLKFWMVVQWQTKTNW